MNELIGKKITGMWVNNDQSILAFDTDKGVVAYITLLHLGYFATQEEWEDCCSETWFADITGVSALLGGTVKTVAYVNMNGYNVDEAYGLKLTTDKGFADIVFRNSSNGYYGGALEMLDRELPEGMIAITDDWQA